jgi:hypothetical protein
MIRNHNSFNLLKCIASEYKIYVTNEAQQNPDSALNKNYEGIGETMSKIIYDAGLIG